ncbi:dTDP-4-dehydrorhamnose reductase [Limimaricola pyoseonensis]|uniref:dTDP-4-dehydrorhamnose reductase n=1 Tax=Limimaricola pyoseonensis TaxID=521013 RepID=A0A1G7KIK2_9RHOB|nr:dTDP-4-dehydrorhamnose reductase [Limimaricola pyoseonensis]SDF36800.1 dTDP-4-dehydrorhamnose reductase [Limimaricola pyoseonensis]
MRVLVFGRSGQVATELARLDGQGHEIRCMGRESADLSDPEGAAKILAREAATGWPHAVINAAAWTAVDAAETEEAAAHRLNAEAPAALARAAAEAGLPFVHISTDYVFDGAGEAPFAPDAPTAPLGAYGRTKLAGEEGVARAGNPAGWAVLRTSWVFSAHGANFVKTMLRLGAERDALNVVADQVGGPTPADAIAQACVTIAEALAADPAKSGVYHFSGAPDTSWAGFAREIMPRGGRDCAIEDIPSSAYPTPAPRPRNSRLDCRATEAAFGIARPDWRAGLDRILTELDRTT